MEQRQLGAGGPMVGAVGIGAMSFSDFYGETTDANSFAILDAAMELGMSHLDTALVYGNGRSETVIGEYLKARGAEARAFFSIATKAGIRNDPQPEKRFDNGAGYLAEALDGCLDRLGVDCVDLFYIHRRESDLPIEEVTETLAALVKAGKTRAIGFSEIAPASLRRAQAVHPVAAVQSEYSLATRGPDLGLVQTCAELGAAMVAFSPVGRSVLTDNPLSADAIAGMPFMATNPRFQSPNFEANRAYCDAFRRLAGEMGVPAAALAIAWVLARGAHVLPIPGTRSVAHLRELAQGAELVLTESDLARIEAVLPVGWAHGDRYSERQWEGPERYC